MALSVCNVSFMQSGEPSPGESNKHVSDVLRLTTVRFSHMKESFLLYGP